MRSRLVPSLVATVVAALLVAGAAPARVARAAEPPAVDAAETPVGSSTWPCPDWGMYGHDLRRTFATRCDTPIDATSAATLVPKWYVDTPKTVTASPAVVDGVVYVGDWTGTMFALDAETGDQLWATPTAPAPGAPFGPIVSSAAVADVRMGDDGPVRRLVFVGAGPRLYALDAADGSEVWVKYAGADVDEEQTEFESSPVIHDGVLYVGLDVHNRTLEETGGVRGGLFAIDPATGETIWYFNPEWDDQRSGCSSVWSSPTVDAADGLVMLATGNCPHDHTEWTPHIEAVTALDIESGAPVWSFQPHDVNRDDLDFGATGNLFVDETGRRVFGIGNKDGAYYALDPATGELLWSTKVAEPAVVNQDFSIGGFIGSTAVWDGDVFGATAFGGPPYMHALDGATGEVEWSGTDGPSYAASAAANGVVFHAGLDDQFTAYEAETGRPVWSAPLSAPSSSGPAIVGDSVYVGAGTSSSDACAKDTPVFSDACFYFFDELLGQTGGVHAFTLALGGDDEPGSGDGGDDGDGEDEGGDEGGAGSAQPAPAPAGADAAGATLPATGSGATALGLALPVLALATSLTRRRPD